MHRQRIPETIQQEIWDKSISHTIGQLSKMYGLSRVTIIRYMNPDYR